MPHPDLSLEPASATIGERWSNHLAMALMAAVVLVADQFTKYLVDRFMVPGQSIPTTGTFRIVYTINTGSAFGLFPGQTLFLVAASIVGITVLVLFYRSHPSPGPLLRVSLGLQLGGAIGNLTDRALFAHVVDFIALGWWPRFNIADSAIVMGIIILVFVMLRTEQHVRRQHITTFPDSSDPPEPTDLFHE